ncbi:isoleucine--tRNA ligase [Candidatus Uabimicrobium amorphum]|uniref:Isoleucine--tRNA ligase n=1 Tax=Uabimicrobium amorphum TaxID=2596890 RepID=A0A5S9F312_UABAM|nr:isoleucine--tRNA ligase [Candidatus Uabimicrobium amorphum]BBM83049.1 isoleucine--tRNA ligase [Candidatus Uabimicrobium amorphum]
MTNYSHTLNLPKTSFPMKANLAKRELEILQLWKQLYPSLRAKRAGQPKFVLHDGPPYANGHVHIGTTLNKVLKDITVKAKNMEGYDAPFVPGWDCHGLPIELQVLKKVKGNTAQLRKACREHAQQYVNLQMQEFKRLGVVADWDAPYLTMNPDFEALTAQKMFSLVKSGALTKGKKPVHWCVECHTALAQAELEYKNHTSRAVYVRFSLVDSEVFCTKHNVPIKEVSLVVWTTTPWTLPANTAVCLHADYQYCVLAQHDEYLVTASDLRNDFCDKSNIENAEVVATFSGKDLQNALCQHPFLSRNVPVVLGEHVNLSQGTGCIHTAPGHGEEDFAVGKEYQLPVLCPVDDYGYFTDEVPQFHGKKVWEVNDLVVETLQQSNTLVQQHDQQHEYPYCWRCHSPVIVRATPQWFVSMDYDKLRERCIEEATKTQWIPQWGKKRIVNMLQKRPDWCVSRQRAWGVPIAVFYCNECDTQVRDDVVMQHVVKLFSQETCDVWFTKPVEDLMPKDYRCCGAQNFTKENDVLDVWFDAGTTQDIVLKRQDLKYPADLYLEGSDQFRGWFQSSLVLAVAGNKSAPYKAVATHGYVVEPRTKNREKQKVSKSRGALFPKDLIEKYGADLLRLWVASENFRDDVEFSPDKLQQVQTYYRKIRNTYRYLLGNLYDDDQQIHKFCDLPQLEKYILTRLHTLNGEVREAYARYEYHTVFQLVQNFFSNELSSLYFDVRKDTLYSESANSSQRRQAQFVLRELLRTTLPWIAPVLSFTAEEIWQHVRKDCDEHSIHLSKFCNVNADYCDAALQQQWKNLLQLRTDILKKLEDSKNRGLIKTFAEAHVNAGGQVSTEYCKILTQLLPVARVSCSDGDMSVMVFAGKKCQRCWQYFSIEKDSGDLCQRCIDVLHLHTE